MFWSVPLSLGLIAVALWIRWRIKMMSFFKDLGIPGPKPSIFFGNMFDYYFKDPLQCHKEWILKYGKVLGFYMGNMPVLLVSDIELLKQIQIKESANFINRPAVFELGSSKQRPKASHHLVALKGQRWKEVRSTMTPAFTSGKMKTMFPIIDDCVTDLLANIKKYSECDESFDLMPLYQRLTMDVIGKTALGIQGTDQTLLATIRMIFSSGIQSLIFVFAFSLREFQSILSHFFKALIYVLNKGHFPFFELGDACEDVVKSRRDDPLKRRPDLLQALIDAEREKDVSITDQQLIVNDDDTNIENVDTKEDAKASRALSKYKTSTVRLTDAEVVANAMIILLAGYETTSSALSFTTHYLLNNLDIQKKIQEEVDNLIEQDGELQYSSLQKLPYLDQVFNESLRICPPIYHFVLRESVYETKLGPYKIPAKTAIMVPVYHIHHDPELWSDPETFDPTRFSPERRSEIQTGTLQTFGIGPRNCIGMRFAQMEAKLTLARLLHQFSLKPCSETQMGPPTFQFSLVSLTMKEGVHLKAVPR